MLFVKGFLKPISRIILMAVLFAVFSVKLMAASETKVMHWTVGGVEREALVYIPESAKLTSTPIVFVFHGHVAI